jgi:hypothetical protein
MYGITTRIKFINLSLRLRLPLIFTRRCPSFKTPAVVSQQTFHCTYFQFEKYPDGIFSIRTAAVFWCQHWWMQILSILYVCFKTNSVLSTFQSLKLLDPKLFPYSDSICDSWFSPWLIRIAFNLMNLKLNINNRK